MLQLKVPDFVVQEVLLVLDGTTGLNMLPQAREFNQVWLYTGQYCNESEQDMAVFY